MKSEEVYQSKYDWYDLVPCEDVIQQGDILFDFPVIITPSDILTFQNKGEETDSLIEISCIDVIVMTQSCDLIKSNPNDIVILCPLYNIKETDSCNKSNWGQIRKGYQIGKYILNKYTSKDISFDYKLVDLQNVLSTKYRVVNEFKNEKLSRIRLLPPYREHLSYHFAYQFMRIGLPEDLPEKFPY